jgi:hypothetical protein
MPLPEVIVDIDYGKAESPGFAGESAQGFCKTLRPRKDLVAPRKLKIVDNIDYEEGVFRRV